MIVHALGWYFPDSLGGTEVYVDGLCRRLQQAGCEVLVAAPEAGGTAERTYTHNGIPVYRYPIPAAPTRDEAQGRVAVRGAGRFHAWLRRRRPDVLHLHGFVTGLGLHEVHAAAAAGARTVLTNHLASFGFICRRGTLMRWGRRPCDGVMRRSVCAACVLQSRGLPRPGATFVGALPPALSRVAGTVPGPVGTGLGLAASIAHDEVRQHRLLELIDAFVVLNQQAADIVRRNGLPDDRVVINRLGASHAGLVRKAGAAERPTRPPVRIGFVGRFHEVKGADILVRAVRRLSPDVPVRVELRGPVAGPADARLLRRVQAIAGEDPRVHVGPALAPAEVGAALARYDLLCCPSLCFENGPTIAIEAHAVGTPVVGSRLGALSELIDDRVNGRLFEPGDVAGLAGLLEEAARDPAATIDRWRCAVPPARTMDAIADDYATLYHRLVGSAVLQG